MTESEQRIPDEWLVEPARRDPAAFSMLYRRHYEAVFRHCARRLFDRSAAKDVTATVFLRVVKNLAAFEGNGQDFRCWLFTITSNAVNEHIRKSRRRKRLFERFARQGERKVATDDSPGGFHAEKVAAVKKAILTLNPKHQSIIYLRFFENMKLTEVAELVGSSAATVRGQLSRALAALRKAMAEQEGTWQEA